MANIVVEINVISDNVDFEFNVVGTQGRQGPQGDSAYQVAVEEGFEGTEEEWLASLKGDPGDDYHEITEIDGGGA